MDKLIQKGGFLDSFIVGGLLGDLHIQKTRAATQKSRLRFCHGIKQIKYLKWKYSIMKDYTPDQFMTFSSLGLSQEDESINEEDSNGLSRQELRDMKEAKFYTYYDDLWTKYHSVWYRLVSPPNILNNFSGIPLEIPLENNGNVFSLSNSSRDPEHEKESIVSALPSVHFRKIIPESIDLLLVNPFSLLVWYYDDGSKRTDCDGARIATQSWTYDEHLLLKNCLMKNFDLEVKIVKSGISKRTKVQHYTVSLSAKSFREFRAFIYGDKVCNQALDHIPSMLYKFETPRND